MSKQSEVDVPDTTILGGHLGFAGVFQTNFDFQLTRVMGAQTYGGAELGECLATARRIPDGDIGAWTREWSALASIVEALGMRSLEQGFVVSAREAFLRASSYYKVSMFFLAHKDPKKRDLWQRARDAFTQAGRLFDHPCEPVLIPFEGIDLTGYFLHDGTGQPRPTVLIQGGGDSTSEEMFFFGGGAAAVRRGFNVLLYEGPGMPGPAILYPDVPYRPDWEKPVKAVVDYAVSRPEVDASRLAIMGYSFGGYMVPRAAAFEKRLRACVAISLVPDPGAGALQIFGFDKHKPIPDGAQENLDLSNPIKVTLMDDWFPRLGAVEASTRLADAARILNEYSLWGLEDKLTCALLNVSTSGEGRLSVSLSRQFFDATASTNKKFVLLTDEDGADGHCGKNNPSRLHQEEFDWLEEVLEVSPRR